MVKKDQNPPENGSTSDARSSAPTRLILNVVAFVQQLQTLFPTPSHQGCVERANNQKPDIDVPRVHTQTATMWNNVYETDEEEFAFPPYHNLDRKNIKQTAGLMDAIFVAKISQPRIGLVFI